MSNIKKKYSVSPTGQLHLRDANDQPMYASRPDGSDDTQKPILWNCFGPGSKEHAAAQAKVNNRFTNRLRQSKKTEVTPEQKAMDDAEFLADCTAGFENLEDDKAVTTARAVIIEQFLDSETGFVRDQCAKYLSDWSNFTRPKATN